MSKMSLKKKQLSFSILISVLFLGVSYSVSFFLPSLLWHVPSWLYPEDLFATLRDAHMILWGGYGIIYSGGSGLLAPPLGPLVLTPLAYLIDAFKLLEPYPQPFPDPTAWPLALAYLAPFLGIWTYNVLRFYERHIGTDRFGFVLTGITTIGAGFVLFPWGHPEDLIALTLCLVIFERLEDDRITSASYIAGIALSFQPFVVLFLIPLWVLRIRSMRVFLSSFARVIFIPALLYAPTLLADFKATLAATVHQPNFPRIDHLTILGLLTLSKGQVMAGPLRIIMVLAAIAIGFIGKSRLDLFTQSWREVFLVSTVALSLRIWLEPVMVPYYAVPFLVFAMLLVPTQKRMRLTYLFVSGALCFAVIFAASLGLVPLQYTVILYLATLATIAALFQAAMLDNCFIKKTISDEIWTYMKSNKYVSDVKQAPVEAEINRNNAIRRFYGKKTPIYQMEENWEVDKS